MNEETITLRCMTATAIHQSGETSTFGKLIHVNHLSNSEYELFFYIEGSVHHIILHDVACIIEGIVDPIF